MTETEALRRGATGEPVRDLQERLTLAGHAVPPGESGTFGPATEAAVVAFQRARGLRVDGACGAETWAAIVESGFRLGDRLLYHRRSMLRGDDVAELQRRLNALGFDAGRGDGILGPQTESALRQFQVNAGLASDGVSGPATVRALERLGSLADGSVASVRELEILRHGSRSLSGRRLYLAVEPGLDSLGEAVRRGLAADGALVVLDTSGSADSDIAAAANSFEADIAVALRTGDLPGARCSYFATRTFRSESGFILATRVEDELGGVLGPVGPPSGKTYGVLRETRMPAIVCAPVCSGDVDGMRAVVNAAADVADAIVRGVRSWAEAPLDARC